MYGENRSRRVACRPAPAAARSLEPPFFQICLINVGIVVFPLASRVMVKTGATSSGERRRAAAARAASSTAEAAPAPAARRSSESVTSADPVHAQPPRSARKADASGAAGKRPWSRPSPRAPVDAVPLNLTPSVLPRATEIASSLETPASYTELKHGMLVRCGTCDLNLGPNKPVPVAGLASPYENAIARRLATLTDRNESGHFVTPVSLIVTHVNLQWWREGPPPSAAEVARAAAAAGGDAASATKGQTAAQPTIPKRKKSTNKFLPPPPPEPSPIGADVVRCRMVVELLNPTASRPVDASGPIDGSAAGGIAWLPPLPHVDRSVAKEVLPLASFDFNAAASPTEDDPFVCNRGGVRIAVPNLLTQALRVTVRGPEAAQPLLATLAARVSLLGASVDYVIDFDSAEAVAFREQRGSSSVTVNLPPAVAMVHAPPTPTTGSGGDSSSLNDGSEEVPALRRFLQDAFGGAGPAAVLTSTAMTATAHDGDDDELEAPPLLPVFAAGGPDDP